MPTELEHRDDDVTPGKLVPITRDDVTPPAGCSYLTFDADYLTFDERRLMFEEN